MERRGMMMMIMMMMDKMKWMRTSCTMVVFRRQSGKRGVVVLIVVLVVLEVGGGMTRTRESYHDFSARERMRGERKIIILPCLRDRLGIIGMCQGDDIVILNGILLRIVVVLLRRWCVIPYLRVVQG